mgnify:CR=1 FL=1
MHRALVIEDQDLMRLALMAELRGRLRNCYLAGAQTLELAKQLLEDDHFDLVVTDPGLPGFDPTSQADRRLVVETVIKAAPEAMHVVVTGSDDQEEAMACRRLGAQGYVCKTGLSQGDLLSVVDQISHGDFLLRLSQVPGRRPEMNFPTLSPREDEVLSMMISRREGTRRREIFEKMAEKTGINPSSAEKYYKNARAKLLKLGRLPKGL